MSLLAAEGLVDTVGDRVVVPDRLRAATADTAETRAARGRLLRHLLTRRSLPPRWPPRRARPSRCHRSAPRPAPGRLAAGNSPTLLAVPDPAFALRLAPALGEQLTDNVARCCSTSGRPRMVTRTCGCGSACACRLGRYAQGAEHLRAALPRLDRPADRAAALLQLAGCRDRQGRRVEALAWYAEAYDACLRVGDQVGRAVALRRLRTRAA